jgi:hypothetical protein
MPITLRSFTDPSDILPDSRRLLPLGSLTDTPPTIGYLLSSVTRRALRPTFGIYLLSSTYSHTVPTEQLLIIFLPGQITLVRYLLSLFNNSRLQYISLVCPTVVFSFNIDLVPPSKLTVAFRPLSDSSASADRRLSISEPLGVVRTCPNRQADGSLHTLCLPTLRSARLTIGHLRLSSVNHRTDSYCPQSPQSART